MKESHRKMNGKHGKLADKEDIYVDAAPMLFGDGFTKEVREHEDQLRCLDRASH